MVKVSYKKLWKMLIDKDMKKIQLKEISLSSKNSKPDYDYMALFMKATQKNAIKDLIEWKDIIINETRKIVNR